MFKDENAEPVTPEQELLTKVIQELDEIKRYSGGTYEKVDTEIAEIRAMCQRIESKINETDRQVDRIESFERQISEIRASVQRMERKIK